MKKIMDTKNIGLKIIGALMLGAVVIGTNADAQQIQHKTMVVATGIAKNVAAVARIAPIPDYQIAVDSNAILNLDAKPLDVANREAAIRTEKQKAIAAATAENNVANAEAMRMQLRDAQLHLTASEMELKQATRAKNAARITQAKKAVAMDKAEIEALQAKIRFQD